MNQGRIWCVVNPTVGLPLFLGSVALISFTVHFAVLNNSSWVKDFFNGMSMTKASVEEAAPATAAVASSATAVQVMEVAQSTLVDGVTPAGLKLTPLTLVPNPG